MTGKEKVQNIKAQMFDADGHVQEIGCGESRLERIGEKQLLWVSRVPRNRKTIEEICEKLAMSDVPVQRILDLTDRPSLNKFGDFYHFFIISIEMDERRELNPVPIDFLVGKNFVVTVHDKPVSYFDAFAEREAGEVHIGELDAESVIATLLDFHLATYFRALEEIESSVDRMDEKILRQDLEDTSFFSDTISLRNQVSRLRRWLLPHRDVFYALSRPDFKQIADSDSFDNFRLLQNHFEIAVEAIESSRETVLSLFDLYTSKASHRMNNSMKRLTFITLMIGGMGVIAGILGMNFKEDFFDRTDGFWVAVSLMFLLTGSLTLAAWKKRWI